MDRDRRSHLHSSFRRVAREERRSCSLVLFPLHLSEEGSTIKERIGEFRVVDFPVVVWVQTLHLRGGIIKLDTKEPLVSSTFSAITVNHSVSLPM
jgi:hypothetical protein